METDERNNWRFLDLVFRCGENNTHKIGNKFISFGRACVSILSARTGFTFHGKNYNSTGEFAAEMLYVDRENH